MEHFSRSYTQRIGAVVLAGALSIGTILSSNPPTKDPLTHSYTEDTCSSEEYYAGECPAPKTLEDLSEEAFYERIRGAYDVEARTCWNDECSFEGTSTPRQFIIPSKKEVSALATALFKDARCYTDVGTSKVYATWLLGHARNYGVDPFDAAALMIKESGCDPSLKSTYDAVGLMQINEATFDTHCKERLLEPVDFGDIGKPMYAGLNIECGIRALRDKTRTFGNGIKESPPYLSTGALVKLVDNCIEQHKAYGTYIGVDAGLRGYNGWGCGPGADIDFVEQVNAIKKRISPKKEDAKLASQ